MRSHGPLLALAAALLAAAPLRAQVLDAMLLDSRGREPVVGAEVALLDASGAAVAQGRTGADGRVRLRAPAAGTYHVRAVRGGAVLVQGSVELAAEETTEVEMLAAGGQVAAAQRGDGAVALDTLAAEAAARRRYLDNAGFYDRQRTTSGIFLTGQQFAERSGARLVDRLGGLRGISIRPAGKNGWDLFQRAAPNAWGSSTVCMARLW